MVAAILIGFALLIVIGIPIGFCLGLIPLISTMFFMRFSPKVIPHEMFSALDSFPLMAIPLFILAGNLMNTARITHQLIALSNSMVGHIKGGLRTGQHRGKHAFFRPERICGGRYRISGFRAHPGHEG